VCTIFAADLSGGVPVIAMEYVDGRPLQSLLNDGPLAQGQVSHLTRQIASGLAAAHAHNIVHGDLKPANVMVTPDGQVKITDFGLSRRVSDRQAVETISWSAGGTGSIAGTPGYMSPEQARGETANPASDVFSLGAVVFEMLTGRRAFEGENVLKVLDQIQHVDPERLAVGTPEPFAGILPRMLTRDFRDRLVTMNQIAQLLG
jgi:serine/threonine-protein kinase